MDAPIFENSLGSQDWQLRCQQLELELKAAREELARGHQRAPQSHPKLPWQAELHALREAFEQSSAPMFVKNATGEYLLANAAWRKLLSPPEFCVSVDCMGKTDHQLLSEEVASRLAAKDQLALNKQESVTIPQQLPLVGKENGALQPMVRFVVPSAEQGPLLVGVLHQTAIDAQSEGELAKEEHFRQLTHRMEQGYWLAHFSGKLEHAYRKVWGMADRAPVLQSFIAEQIHPDDLPHVQSTFDRWIQGEAEKFEVQYRVVTAEGQTRWVEDQATKIVYEDGRPSQASGVIRDITERKEAEFALRESESRYRLLADNSTDLITRHSVTSGIKYASPACKALLGFEPHEMVGLSAFDIVHPEDHTRLQELRFHLLAGNTLAPSAYRFRKKEGGYIWLEVRGRSIVNPNTGEVEELIATSRNVTDRINTIQQLREREVELAHAERLSAMGQMAAQLAHEINQPLFAIVNYAEACQSVLQKQTIKFDEDLSVWIDHIAEQSRRVGQIIRRVQQLSRTGEINFSVFDINECVRLLLPLFVWEQRRSDIQIDSELAAELPAVFADRILIEQVIVNLIRNAHDAMSEKPKANRAMLIRTRALGKDQVVVDVIDRGTGIAVEDQHRIFEPYYSTKAQGLGLGLAICKTILSAHEGRITCENNSDEGSTFSVFLPVATAP